jgi:hypothetical protein
MTLLAVKLLVDFFMIVLLGATIFYCVIVNKRIRTLQDSRNDFAQLLTQFDDTTRKAQASIEDLQKMAGKVTDSLNERLDKANFLADDLAFMIEKGNKIAEKVDNTLPREDRSAKTVLPPKREPSISRKNKKTEEATEGLLKAAGKPARSSRSKSSKVESMLERMAESEKDGPKPKSSARRTSRASSRLRSRAEQELQDALKTGDES